MVTSPQASVAPGTSKAQVLVHSAVLLPTQVMVGLVVSLTVIVCTQLVLLPHKSVAVQVRAMSFVPPQPSVVVSLKLTVATPQSS